VPDTGAVARRQQILDAAVACFGRYGYQRTSMETIARSARISRPALYQYFSGKDEVFRAMGVRMLDAALTRAEAARHRSGPVADRLYAVLAVKLDLAIGHGMHGGQGGHNGHNGHSDHSGRDNGQGFGSEVLSDAATFAGDLLASFQVRLISIVEALLCSTPELDLAVSTVPAHDVAVVLVDAVAGIEGEHAPPPTLRLRVRQLVELTIRGLAAR
jgi:TetR/AcrR family transcriptional regulator